MKLCVFNWCGFTDIAAWTVSYPFDVIKSQYQAARDHTYKVVWNRAVKSFRTKGWHAFTYPVYALLK
ncbi:unnamed protein product [Rotaria sp. Silwood2]|nr:unnamed protein product [Rotaria sp. Silwood2]CAF4147473.1 unnamed protein product [Rotaria sp. Silwood2]